MNNGARTPVLLADAGYYGTLAAARALGRYGVPVTVIDPTRSAPALWSRHVAQRLKCPPLVGDLDGLVDWLVRFGESNPKHVVLATSDDVSFALAIHGESLAERMLVAQPGLASLIRIFDKGRLMEDARAVGLDVPDTWLPQCDADVDRAAREANAVLVVKPRTQVLLATHLKGVIADTSSEVAAAYARFRRMNEYAPALASRFPEATWPMLQRYHPAAMDQVYSLAGFRDASGESFAVLAANKVLQRPRRLGVGLCFEEAPVDPALAAGVKRLCERIGYFGVFEVEFIREGDRSLLIDMNGRLYNQIAFDVARGLPLPQLAYFAALNDRDEVARLMANANAHDTRNGGTARGFCNRFGFEVLVGANRLTGKMSHDEIARWRAWRDEREGGMVDAVADRDDPLPFAFEVASQVYGYLRHPRSFVRTMALSR